MRRLVVPPDNTRYIKERAYVYIILDIAVVELCA